MGFQDCTAWPFFLPNRWLTGGYSSVNKIALTGWKIISAANLLGAGYNIQYHLPAPDLYVVR
jgi:hypothetical protein